MGTTVTNALVATDKVENVMVHSSTWKQGRIEQAPVKMSKSLKNVVNPDDGEQYGADTLVSS